MAVLGSSVEIGIVTIALIKGGKKMYAASPIGLLPVQSVRNMLCVNAAWIGPIHVGISSMRGKTAPQRPAIQLNRAEAGD